MSLNNRYLCREAKAETSTTSLILIVTGAILVVGSICESASIIRNLRRWIRANRHLQSDQ
ncbi:hypothetical protein BJX64DRAFT_254284 [Aspergillus heterothallicus]